jgi:hypothetical protein
MIYDDKLHEVHFGHSNYSNLTEHQNEARRDAYLQYAYNIRGKWRDNKDSPNNLAINTLWM